MKDIMNVLKLTYTFRVDTYKKIIEHAQLCEDTEEEDGQFEPPNRKQSHTETQMECEVGKTTHSVDITHDHYKKND